MILGIPGHAGNPWEWVIAVLSVAGANALQWASYRRWAATIAGKRTETQRLLDSLLAGGHDAR